MRRESRESVKGDVEEGGDQEEGVLGGGRGQCSITLIVFLQECTQAIMSDAIRRKQLWMKRLEDLKVEGLLAQRDIVLATSIEHMAGVDDCKMNLEQIKLSVRL